MFWYHLIPLHQKGRLKLDIIEVRETHYLTQTCQKAATTVTMHGMTEREGNTMSRKSLVVI
jgi:hypothetical protein